MKFVAAIIAAVLGGACAAEPATNLNVSYDVSREFSGDPARQR